MPNNDAGRGPRAPASKEFILQVSLVQKPVVRAKATGVIRHWNTGTDIAELFIDHSVRPEGSVRFIWMRSPWVAGQQASLRP